MPWKILVVNLSPSLPLCVWILRQACLLWSFFAKAPSLPSVPLPPPSFLPKLCIFHDVINPPTISRRRVSRAVTILLLQKSKYQLAYLAKIFPVSFHRLQRRKRPSPTRATLVSVARLFVVCFNAWAYGLHKTPPQNKIVPHGRRHLQNALPALAKVSFPWRNESKGIFWEFWCKNSLLFTC